MNKIKQKQIDCYVVLYYYHLVDETKGKSIEEVPMDIRDTVELLANERLAFELNLQSEITSDITK